MDPSIIEGYVNLRKEHVLNKEHVLEWASYKKCGALMKKIVLLLSSYVYSSYSYDECGSVMGVVMTILVQL